MQRRTYGKSYKPGRARRKDINGFQKKSIFYRKSKSGQSRGLSFLPNKLIHPKFTGKKASSRRIISKNMFQSRKGSKNKRKKWINEGRYTQRRVNERRTRKNQRHGGKRNQLGYYKSNYRRRSTKGNDKNERKKYSWYIKGEKIKFKNWKDQGKSVRDTLNKLKTNNQENRIEMTYSKTSKLFYCIQMNIFLTKEQLAKYDIEEHKRTMQQQGARKANYQYIRKDQDLLYYDEKQEAWYSTKEDKYIKVKEMTYVPENVSKEIHSYYNNEVAKIIREKREEREKRKKEEKEKNDKPKKDKKDKPKVTTKKVLTEDQMKKIKEEIRKEYEHISNEKIKEVTAEHKEKIEKMENNIIDILKVLKEKEETINRVAESVKNLINNVQNITNKNRNIQHTK